ncbi:pyridoxamine 5'-phosphate oxidase family protein [Microbacterium sp. H37-C3]|uniref:pyridoxamine 5'-phosphate oxidase family protein n=1 Tax=Microbacterium sp. H37-C3 TaxID=3004354 RepID=UPI0022AF16A1|nr:pyridoxamine 5'-phosphate oxidase family protein [Microbacterium sp. H37-C3]MCZ4068070.1 pyridoxamine 5'-phosphate oxidase family protein [Microbacterium sp. H37-C3]
MSDNEDPRAILAELLPEFRFAMVTTVDESGKLTARPLTVQEAEFDGDLWFVVDRGSSVATHVASRPAVGVALSKDDAWVSLAGEATIVDDRARLEHYWSSTLEAWFPDGPDDPSITLLRVDAISGEYWSSAGGRIATAIGLIKSKITGETYEGRNEKLDL